jgi:phenylacetate-coenzyme A ligase PaaK-like adenylate-forming protein
MSITKPRTTFDKFRQDVQASMLTALPAAIDRLHWSADQLAAHQRDELRSLVAHAIAHSPFHRRRLAGCDPSSLQLADLSTFPVMTKDEMMDELDDVLTDPGVRAADVERALHETTTEPVPIAGRVFAMASGGSSGRRGVFCFDRDATVAFLSSISRHSVARLQAFGDPPPGGITIAIVGAPSPVHATGTAQLFSAGHALPFQFSAVPVTLPFPEIVERLNTLGAPLLYGYPSMLARLAEEQRAGRLHLQLLGVTSTSETLLPELRATIRDAFGVPIVDTFGSTEALVGVSAPDDDVLVFNSDQCIVELVDEQDRPVPDGTPSAKVLITNLANRTQPLIRYAISDRFVRQPAAPDHGHLRARVEGRDDDALRFGSVTVHPLVIRAVMVKTPAVADYQVRQKTGGIDVDAIAVAPVDPTDLRDRLARALSDAGLAAPVVSVRMVDGLERDARTGKIRRFQPLR